MTALRTADNVPDVFADQIYQFQCTSNLAKNKLTYVNLSVQNKTLIRKVAIVRIGV